MNSIGEGVFLRIPKGKEIVFWNIILEAGYEKTPDGIVQFILEYTEEEPNRETDVGGVVIDWIQQNPEQWQEIKKKGSHVIGSLAEKIKKFTS